MFAITNFCPVLLSSKRQMPPRVSSNGQGLRPTGLPAPGRIGISTVVSATATVDGDKKIALAVKGDGVIGCRQTIDNGFGRSVRHQLVVECNAHKPVPLAA